MKTLIIVVVLVLPLSVMSQFQKGTIYVSGDAGFSTSEALTSYSINPSLGMMVSESWGVGLAGGVRNTEFADSDQSSLDFSVGPLVEKYFEISDKVMLSLNGKVLYQKTVEPTDVDAWRVGVTPSLLFFPIDNLAVTGSLGSISFSSENNGVFAVRYGNIGLGLSWFLAGQE